LERLKKIFPTEFGRLEFPAIIFGKGKKVPRSRSMRRQQKAASSATRNVWGKTTKMFQKMTKMFQK
jgi:hypothetical protein